MLLPVHGVHYRHVIVDHLQYIKGNVNSVDYIISTPGHYKAKKLCHVNMLKAYHEKQDKQVLPRTISVASSPPSNFSSETQ